MTDPTKNVLAEIAAERARQDAKWGEQNHPDVDRVLTDREGSPKVIPSPFGNVDAGRYPGGCTAARMAEEYGVPTASRARANCDGAAKIGQCTWAHIAVEELAEAIEAATEAQQGRAPVADLRKELVQTAAVIVAWVEAIDRRDP